MMITTYGRDNTDLDSLMKVEVMHTTIFMTYFKGRVAELVSKMWRKSLEKGKYRCLSLRNRVNVCAFANL